MVTSDQPAHAQARSHHVGDGAGFVGQRCKQELLEKFRERLSSLIECYYGRHLAAAYQHAIVRALVERTREAADQTGRDRIAIVGGVAANSELRAALPDATAAPLALCTDNAAMIASAARWIDAVPYPRYLALDAYASR